MKLSEAQLKILNDKNPRVVVVASAASGKALSHGSKLYTVNGPIFIENAKIGDKIYGEDGNLHQITGVFPQGKKKEYIVTFSDRTQIKCCNEHLWTFQTESLRSHKSSTWITASLQEIIDKYPLYKDARAKNNFGKGKSLRKNIFIPMTQPIQFPEQELKIEPYTMGALLGDGSFRNNIFTNEDKDVLQWVNEGLLSIGASLKHIGRYDYQILTNHKHIFSDILKQYNLWQTNSETKFIPNEYKYNSINNRLLLLQGLIDTDGYCKGSSYDLVLKSKQLILDCKEVCESLGLTATLSEKRAICNNSAEGKKDCGIVYRLHIKTSKLFPKLHRSAKREKQWRPTS
ncbi:MAG TPA: LAGLIDADG family homing endonuclease, partial [Defluviitaleaceae bacterium]|nr:LAGLIDADG family homing endonuclease [Defluviitaleaceae bacterium]